MKAQLIGVESMVGVGKESGKPYEIYTVLALMPVSTRDREVATEHWTRKKEGYVLLSQQVNEPLYNRARNIGINGYPVDVEMELEQRVTQKGMVSDLIEINAAGMPPKLATGSK